MKKLIPFAVVLFAAVAWWIMPPIPATEAIILDATTKTLELVTTSTGEIHYLVNYADHTTTTFTSGSSLGKITTATTTTIMSAPAASTQRQVKGITIRNTSTTTSNTVTLQVDVSGANHEIYQRVLAPGESIDIDSTSQVRLYDASGRKVESLPDVVGTDGRTYAYQKAGGAKDAAGYWYSTWKDAGFPGAYSLGSPGLNGFTTDCSTASNATDPVGAAQMGAHILPDPAAGSLYLSNVTLGQSIAEIGQLIDIVWYNTGTVVTTTTAQTITMPTLPSRDTNGTNNGVGWYAALYSSVANTNAGTIANTTISYTDQDGNAGNTGTFAALVGWQAPVTPVIGTWMPFQLAAGDTGIRSIQSLTLGTSYGAGNLVLVLYRVLATVGYPVANIAVTAPLQAPGVKIWPNSCLVYLQVGSASAANVMGSYTITER